MAQTMMHLLKDVFKNFNNKYQEEIIFQREFRHYVAKTPRKSF